MQIYNQTRYVSEFTQGMDPAGREFLSLVVKGTFAFPDGPRDRPRACKEQRPLVMADEFTGEPGFSATLWETDFAFRKHRCDVILQGAAYAPGGKPAERVRVGLKVGGWSKTIDVLGDREWRNVGPKAVPTRPRPFLRQPFSYDTAFGGPDRLDPDNDKPDVYRPNPVGMGWSDGRNPDRLPGLPLPNTQMPDEDVRSPYGTYRPAAFGPIGRGWPQRLKYGGTYDQNWIDHIFPFLPPDFDERYYQSAPEDQQIDPPAPLTEVVIVNLTPNRRETFRLPRTDLPITVFRRRDIVFEKTVRPDTLIFDTEARVFSMVWRIDVPILRIITEFTEAWIGAPTRAMERAQATGKTYIRRPASRESA